MCLIDALNEIQVPQYAIDIERWRVLVGNGARDRRHCFESAGRKPSRRVRVSHAAIARQRRLNKKWVAPRSVVPRARRDPRVTS